MANYAYVLDGKIEGVYDLLPKNWKNISNFNALNDEEIENFNWYKLTKVVPDYDSTTQKLSDPIFTVSEGVVYETYTIIDLPPPPPPPPELIVSEDMNRAAMWEVVRIERDRLMKEMDWRYLRYSRQMRMNITPTDNIEELDAYMQALADITLQADPGSIIWPTCPV